MPTRFVFISVLVLVSVNQMAQAGMPSVGLTEIASLRIQSISFFLLVLLVSAWVFKKLWNMLARDFPKMPVLKALSTPNGGEPVGEY